MRFGGADFGGAMGVDHGSSGVSAVQFKNADDDSMEIKKKENHIALVSDPSAHVMPASATKSWEV